MVLPKLFEKIPSWSGISQDKDSILRIYVPSEDEDVLQGLARLSETTATFEAFLAKQFEAFLCLPPVIQGLVGVNVFIWFLCNLSDSFMRRHCGVSVKNVREGRWWSVFISAFSHQSIAHLMGNMSILMKLGGPVAEALGCKRFLLLVLGSAVGASLIATTWTWLTAKVFRRDERLQQHLSIPTIGFSGVNMALFYLFSEMRPNSLVEFVSLPLTTSPQRSAIENAEDVGKMVVSDDKIDDMESKMGNEKTVEGRVVHTTDSNELVKGSKTESIQLNSKTISVRSLFHSFVCADVSGLLVQLFLADSPIAHGCHLGGVACGMIAKQQLLTSPHTPKVLKRKFLGQKNKIIKIKTPWNQSWEWEIPWKE